MNNYFIDEKPNNTLNHSYINSTKNIINLNIINNNNVNSINHKIKVKFFIRNHRNNPNNINISLTGDNIYGL